MPRFILRLPKAVWFTTRPWAGHLLFWVGAISVACAAIFLAKGSEVAHQFIHYLVSISPLIPLLLTPAGLALSAWLTRHYFKGTQGSGIPQAIAALQIEAAEERNALLSLRIAFSKIGLTLLGLFAGAAIGREGPTVQVGSSIMYGLGRFIQAPQRSMEKALILAGGAAGVAAAFNTPLAGVVFAIEEMSRSFEQRTSGTVITAVIIAGVTSLAIQGNYAYFGHTAAALGAPGDWLAVPICGIIGGLLGGIYSRILLTSAAGLPGRLGHLMREQPVRFSALCGFVLALIGILSHSTTYCTGYDEAKMIVEGTGTLPASFGLLKMLSSIVSYASGIPGGIFAPSLAVGAGFGANLSHLLPHVPAGAVVILGMVAYFSGVVQAPITAFVIVMEMTDNHAMVLPLMATALIAEGASRLVCTQPVYKALAQRFLGRNGTITPAGIEKEMG